MNLTDTPLIERLSRYLDAAAQRGAVVAGNIANLDTPGYHTRDLDFRSQLAALMGNVQQKPRVVEVQGLTERPDGNNVNMDREGLALGQTQLQFQTGITLLKAQLRQISSAIHEGGTQQ